MYEELVTALRERAPAVRLHPQVWDHDDPTDHAAIYEFLRMLLPRLRLRCDMVGSLHLLCERVGLRSCGVAEPATERWR